MENNDKIIKVEEKIKNFLLKDYEPNGLYYYNSSFIKLKVYQVKANYFIFQSLLFTSCIIAIWLDIRAQFIYSNTFNDKQFLILFISLLFLFCIITIYKSFSYIEMKSIIEHLYKISNLNPNNFSKEVFIEKLSSFNYNNLKIRKIKNIEIQQKNLKEIFIEHLVKWALNGDLQDATRLGYFLIMGGLIKPHENTQESWLQALNDNLKLKNPLKLKVLVKNPWDENGRRSVASIKKSISRIKELFEEYEWEKGLELIKKGEI